MVLDAALLNNQHYKVRSRVNSISQGNEWRPPFQLGMVAYEKGAFKSH